MSIIGIGCGHVYYFLEDVFPEQPSGFKILKTPYFLLVLLNLISKSFRKLLQSLQF